MKFNKHFVLTASLILALSAGVASCGDDEESCDMKSKSAECKEQGMKLDRKTCECIVSSCTKTCNTETEVLDEDKCICTPKGCDKTSADCEADGKELDTAKCECVEIGTASCTLECTKENEILDKDNCKCVENTNTCNITCKDDEDKDTTNCKCVPKQTCNLTCTKEDEVLDKSKCECISKYATMCENYVGCKDSEEFDTKECKCVPKGEAGCTEVCKENEMLAPDECVCIGKPAHTCDKQETCPQGQEFDPGLCKCVDPSQPKECNLTNDDCGDNAALDKDLCQCFPADQVCTLECSGDHQLVNKENCVCTCEKGFIMTGNECQPVETCGNGKLDEGEFCDTDGNGHTFFANPSDADCKKWQMGNYEENGIPACNDKCSNYGGQGTCEINTGEKKCGNNKLDANEFCDMVDGVPTFKNPADAVCSEANGFDPKAGGSPSCNLEKNCVIDKGTCQFMNISTIIQGFHSCSATFEYDSASNTVKGTATYNSVNPNPDIHGIVICDTTSTTAVDAISKFGKSEVFATGANDSISFTFNVSNPPNGQPLTSGDYTCFFYIIDNTYQTKDGRGVICTDKADYPNKTMGEYNSTVYFSI